MDTIQNKERPCETCPKYKYSEYIDAKMCSSWKCIWEEEDV